MTNEEIFNKVVEMVKDQLGVADDANITMETSFIEDLNADSLDMVELVMAMEQEFDLTIPDEIADKVKTVGDAVEYIKSNG